MKRTRHVFKTASCLAAGIVLAQGAQAVVTLVGDTTITFDNASLNNGDRIPTAYGSNATGSTPPGVVVGSSGLGLGTPDVSLNWETGPFIPGGQTVQFDYYNSSALLNNAGAGNSYEIAFTVPSTASLKLTSFNFQSLANDGNTYNFVVSVRNLSATLSSQLVSVPGNTIKDSIVLNIAGGLGDTLFLDIQRSPGTPGPGGNFGMAFDDLAFVEVVPEPGTTALLGLGLGGMALMAVRRWRK